MSFMPAVRQIVEYNSADADRLGDLVLVLDIRVLLGHDLADLLYRLGEELFEDDDVSGLCVESFEPFIETVP